MQTLHQSASLKNNYLYRIQIILADIQARAYTFMVKGIPRGFNIFTRKNKRCYVSLDIPYIGPSFSRDHHTVTIEQGVQGVQAFTFCVLTVNDEHTRQT